MKLFLRLLSFAFLIALVPIASAQESSPAPSAAAVVPIIAPDADAATATRAWLDTVPGG